MQICKWQNSLHPTPVINIKGPSRQDQESVGEATGYVFGISAGSLIYIYDKDGVQATLPVNFVKKMRKQKVQSINKVATNYAGIFPAFKLPYLF